ncbi:MAG: hypothetical protein EOP50_16975, partial [Sphingobacteriales bacterium]
MRTFLAALLVLLFTSAFGQSDGLRPSLLPWSSIGVSDRMAFSADGQNLLFTADGQVMIYDLKKRAMLAAVPGVAEGVLEVAPAAPYFYTWSKGASGGIQKRSLPLGRLVETTPIPKGYQPLSGLLIEPDFESGSLLTAVEGARGPAILQMGNTG